MSVNLLQYIEQLGWNGAVVLNYTAEILKRHPGRHPKTPTPCFLLENKGLQKVVVLPLGLEPRTLRL